ncbi:MAG TPA: tRNA (guanosine(46)-N7)-methyltransferase TrmB [Nevskiaceae bacterium]|nr:tRNA (guanosine(46)-N7)-methyltransferase TrmB [Nevskiaceae bacterium]
MSAPDTVPEEARRRIRSFVRREGRITDAQKDALERLVPRYGLDHVEGPLDLVAIFGRSAPVTFEIGFGNGDALLARAQANPSRDYVGVEVHRPGLGRLLHHVERAGLANVRAMGRDAVDILRDQVADAALDEIVIEFPDPWHKKRHHKRRLVQPEFVRLACDRLAIGGRLILATDWEPYARHMLEALATEPRLENLAADGRFVPRPASRPKTRFECRGERLGHAVFDLAFVRRRP